MAMSSNPFDRRADRIDDFCWLCGHWQLKKFVFTPQNHDLTDDIFIHLSCDDFEPFKMERDVEDMVYYLIRMCPPGKLTYFFTDDMETCVDENQFWVQAVDPIIKTVRFLTTHVEVVAEKLNVMEIPNMNSEYEVGFECEIRPTWDVDAPTPILPKKEAWSFENSIFKSYKPDTAALLAKCFEKDWGDGKIPKAIRNEEETSKVKEICRRYYPKIRETYKYYSAVNMSGE
eukprot:CAMPEP_0115032682 /NCGR_PEP_ID=MMETSP0216-20121206/39306_1 /TAXON_ID=223996 /ORGANISM="Protocruzia adherens, Strain Boccale" /LENGTH=229 /DNA_ID=CAMNT_0002410633 /DNA_START=306 /DNA_END=995 /DNA_ORIENTATION=+